jgi:hypothetical protein
MIDKKSLNVDVKEIPEMHVAYVRTVSQQSRRTSGTQAYS